MRYNELAAQQIEELVEAYLDEAGSGNVIDAREILTYYFQRAYELGNNLGWAFEMDEDFGFDGDDDESEI